MTFSCRLIPKECIHRVQFGINYKEFGTKCWNSGLFYYSGIVYHDINDTHRLYIIFYFLVIQPTAKGMFYMYME